MPVLRLAKTLWGVDAASQPDRWDELFARIKSEGFDAVEAIRPIWRIDTPRFLQCLEKHGLKLICQIHTTGGDIDANGEYLYLTSCKVADHISSFDALLREAASLGPVIINSHSGHDSWSESQAVEYFSAAIALEKAYPHITVVHETHRQRLLYSPYSATALLGRPELSQLRINADLSHWCCVCEHVFDPKLARDDWWPQTLELVARHCHFVHCRVGHSQGPQVADPDAPEAANEVAAHFDWWRQIWAAQAARQQSEVWAEPEFGPPPYMQTLPYTQVPVADLWEVNKRVATKIRVEHARAVES